MGEPISSPDDLTTELSSLSIGSAASTVSTPSTTSSSEGPNFSTSKLSSSLASSNASITSSSRESTSAIDSPTSEIPQQSSPIQNMSVQMKSDELGALPQTPKDILGQLLALYQRLKSLDFLITSSTTATISSSKDLTSDPNSPTPEILHYDNSAQYGSSQGNIDELGALFHELKASFQTFNEPSFKIFEDDIKRRSTLIQNIRSETESVRTFLETFKSREEPPSGVIQIFEEVMVSKLPLIEALESGAELQLAWVQTYKNSMMDSSLLMIPTNEGMLMQTAPTPLVEKMMDLSSLPSTQEPKDSTKLLQTSVQAPKDSTKPTEIPAQAFEALIIESRDLVQFLKNATAMQVTSNQVLKYEIDTHLLSLQCFQYAEKMELSSIQKLDGVDQILLRSIRPLLDTAKM